jgi:hypothetical protein
MHRRFHYMAVRYAVVLKACNLGLARRARFQRYDRGHARRTVLPVTLVPGGTG